MKKSIWVIILFMVGVVLTPLTTQAAPLKKLSWRAEYYDNTSLSGPPKLAFFEADLVHDWGFGSPTPEIPNDYFSARWTAIRHFEKGTYLFFLTVDDGARVWFDGRLIADLWDIGHKEKYQIKLFIDTTGDHELQVAYFENTGKAVAKLEWIQLGGPDDIVGAWQGEYFVNKDLAGSPTLVRADGAINFDWNSGSPDARITRDNFSVRWTRSIYLDYGYYLFRIQHDDGMRIYVDGKVIYDSWYDQAVTYQTRKVLLNEGYRTFVVEYYEHVGNAIAFVSIDGDPGTYDDTAPDPGTVGVVVDNNSPRFYWGGPLANRYTGHGGYESGFYWTYNSSTAPINFGVWTAPVANTANYEVYAYIPASNATTTSARYRIAHYGERTDRVINQSLYHNEWVSLGIYYFAGDGKESVSLYDNTGEANSNTQVAFDAIKFVRR